MFGDTTTHKSKSERLELFRGDVLAAHVGNQNLRNLDGAVSLLVIFHDGSDSTADSQAGAIQRMNEFRFRARGSAEADFILPCIIPRAQRKYSSVP